MLSTLPCLHPLCLVWTLTSRTAALAPERGRCLWGRGRTAYDHHDGDGGSLEGTGGAASCRVGMTLLKAGGRQQLMTNMQICRLLWFIYTCKYLFLSSLNFSSYPLFYVFLFHEAHVHTCAFSIHSKLWATRITIQTLILPLLKPPTPGQNGTLNLTFQEKMVRATYRINLFQGDFPHILLDAVILSHIGMTKIRKKYLQKHQDCDKTEFLW